MTKTEILLHPKPFWIKKAAVKCPLTELCLSLCVSQLWWRTYLYLARLSSRHLSHLWPKGVPASHELARLHRLKRESRLWICLQTLHPERTPTDMHAQDSRLTHAASLRLRIVDCSQSRTVSWCWLFPSVSHCETRAGDPLWSREKSKRRCSKLASRNPAQLKRSLSSIITYFSSGI